ncbi:MAG TPA: S41 family peptidase [Thermoanaerobaculia bacterium]
MKRQALLAIPFLISTAAALAAEPPARDFPALGREIVGLVKERFYDPGKAERWVAANADYAAGIRDAETFRRETRRRLAELQASHTEYYGQDDPGHRDLLSIFEPVLKRSAKGESLGVGFVEQDGGWFVARVFAGGPAEAAGLRRGDRVVSADGAPFHPVLSLRDKAGRPVALEIQSRKDGPLRTLSVTPRITDPKEEWLEAQKAGSRVVERKGRRVAYVPIWSCAGNQYQEALAKSLQGDLQDAEALVIDFRGGWGGCNPTFVALFDPAVPDLTRIDRDGSRTVWSGGWRKPVVVLVDQGTRSGKEMVSRALQKNRRAVIVGERSAGAVLAGQIIPLSDGSLLFLAVQDILVDGERLEGPGVTPDVLVPPELPYAEGGDSQLERALDVAAGNVKAR